MFKKILKKISGSDKQEQKTKQKTPEEIEQEKQKKRRANCIKDTIGKTGWDYDYAAEQIDAAVERFGITYPEYRRNNFCRASEEELQDIYDKMTAKKLQQEKEKEQEKRQQEKNRKRVEGVMEATGWDYDYAVSRMEKAHEISGVSYEHYLVFQFWKLSDDEQKTFFTKKQADDLKEKYHADPVAQRIFWNKKKFLECFSEYTGRVSLTTEEISRESMIETFGEEGKVIYKPQASSGGQGIKVFDYDADNIDDVVAALDELSDGVVENFLVQHEEMQKLSTQAVNTIRFVTVCTEDESHGIETGKLHIMYAGLRMAGPDSYLDNLHSGGMVAGVDIESGTVTTDGVNFKGEVFERYPVTETVIKGFRIPCFEEAKEMLRRAGHDIEGYFGWDVAISKDGPVVIEVNTHPGAEILQMPYVPERKGMRYVAEPYLREQKDMVRAEMPYGTKISRMSRDGVEFYWKKPEFAKGYEVYRSYDESMNYEKIATLDRRDIGDYTDSSFDHDRREIFYRVKSFYDDENGHRSYSGMSEPAKAEFRDIFEIDIKEVYLYAGLEKKVHALYGWGEAEDAVWRSGDESVATVDPDGNITAVSKGVCEISCRSEELNEEISIKVEVDRDPCEPLLEITSRFSYNDVTGFWENRTSEKSDECVIMMVGDMMCGSRQMRKQHSEPQGWNFNDSFKYVRPAVREADFVMGNLETLIASPWPYMIDEAWIDNMNNCNAPSRYLDAVRYGGFDAVSTSNNHNCDGGKQALLDTIDQVDRYELANTGAFRNREEKRFFIADINGIKVGFMAYMTEDTNFNGKDADWSQDEKDTHLNLFSCEKAEHDVRACKAAGAEYVIAYMHWGKKNFRNPTKDQLVKAQEAADAGFDYIVGANPHLVQEYDVIDACDGRKVPCFYSMGNFQAVMNQVPGNRESLIVRIKLKKEADGSLTLEENNYIPCYCYTNCDGACWATVPLSADYNSSRKKGEGHYAGVVDTVGNKIKAL